MATLGYEVSSAHTSLLWASVGGIVGAASGAGGAFALYLILRQSEQLAEIEALVNVRPLTGGFPLDLGGWAADPVFGDGLVRLLCGRSAERIVECGSGWSTLLMAACLEELGDGYIVSLEHDSSFAKRTEDLLKSRGLSKWVDVVVAPLEDYQLGGKTWRWYSSSAVKEIKGPIDLLVVDGPPASVGPFSRYPAVPVFEQRLAVDCAIILDDGLREHERWIGCEWARMLGAEAHLVRRGKGYWQLKREKAGK